MMYMAFARPIIGVIKGDGRKCLVEAGGSFYADENPKSVAEAILAVKHMSEKEKTLFGKLNRAYYDTNFSLKSVTKKIEQYLK